MHGYKEGRFFIKKMIRLGLTGGVGMGKSTASQFLYDLGFKVADTDDIARTLVEPGKPALELSLIHI